MGGLGRGTAGVGGGMFSWSESLSSLGVGSSGCGKRMPVMLVDPSSQIRRNPAMRSWIAASCSGVRTEPSGAFVAAERGGTGSGVVFSSTLTGDSACEALDMCVEKRVDDRVEEGGWRT